VATPKTSKKESAKNPEMDLCEGEPLGCVGTGEALVAPHELWTDFLGTCAAAYASVPGACALVHYDETSAGMRERTIRCAAALGSAVWVVQRGTRCTRADRECVAALREGGHDVRTGGQGARARVAPA
jgi:hypothetical protein